MDLHLPVYRHARENIDAASQTFVYDFDTAHRFHGRVELKEIFENISIHSARLVKQFEKTPHPTTSMTVIGWLDEYIYHGRHSDQFDGNSRVIQLKIEISRLSDAAKALAADVAEDLSQHRLDAFQQARRVAAQTFGLVIIREYGKLPGRRIAVSRTSETHASGANRPTGPLPRFVLSVFDCVRTRMRHRGLRELSDLPAFNPKPETVAAWIKAVKRE